MIHIQMDDLVGNAFISYLQETGKRRLTIQKIEDFAHSVVKDLNSSGTEVALELSRDETTKFFNYYSEWFSYLEKDNVIVLRDDITVKQLIEEFSGCLSLDVLSAYRKYDNVKKLF